MRRRYGNQGFIVYLIYILIICTIPILLWLILVPLKALNIIGDIGVKLFGEGNGALFLIVLMGIFIVFLKLVINRVERNNKKEKDRTP
jgi:hypothetical protein